MTFSGRSSPVNGRRSRQGAKKSASSLAELHRGGDHEMIRRNRLVIATSDKHSRTDYDLDGHDDEPHLLDVLRLLAVPQYSDCRSAVAPEDLARLSQASDADVRDFAIELIQTIPTKEAA